MKAEHDALRRGPVHGDDVLFDGIAERTRQLSLDPLPVQAVRAANARRGVVGPIRPSRSLQSLRSSSSNYSNVKGGSPTGEKVEYLVTLQTSPDS